MSSLKPPGPGSVPVADFVTILREAPLNVQYPEYGAKGDGTPSDYAALQAALNALPSTGGDIYFPPDSGHGYLIGSTPLKVLKNNVRLIGPGRLAATLVSATGDVLQIGDASTDVNCLTVEGLTLQSNSGGGHVVTSPRGINRCMFTDVRLKQANAAKNLWRHAGGAGMIDNAWWNCEFEHVAGAAVPGFYLYNDINTQGVNANNWQKCTVYYSGEFFFHLESNVASTYNVDNTFRDITAEDTRGGIMKLLGAQGTTVENVRTYDLASATTRDLFFLGKATSGPRSVRNKFENCDRRGGSLGASKADIRVDDAFFTEIARCDTSAGSGYTIELNSNPYVTLRDLGDAVTINNVGAYTAQLYGYGRAHFPEGLVSKVKAGPPIDGDFAVTPPNGTGPILDSANNRAYYRVNGAWKYAALT